MDILKKRSLGILMHITSLPSKYGIGDLGEEAKKFASSLAECNVRFWQILPLGPTGFGNSPYASQSAFAGNELLVSPDLLFQEGYLRKEEINRTPLFSETKVDFQAVRAWKETLLCKAATRALKDSVFCSSLCEYMKTNSYWLEDYALFKILYKKHGTACWHKMWSENEAKRDANTLKLIKEQNRSQFDVICAIQFFFERQLLQLRNYISSLNLALIGDIPIFVGMDSADTWASPFLFKTDKNGTFTDVTGVPPDNFSKYGQLWGNPAYDWVYHKETDFKWWIQRIKRCLQMTDVIRIDHFRGFLSYYNIKATEKTAENGVWIASPGEELFCSLKKTLGEIPIIAEDLGNITEDVVELRLKYGFPGMKISQFGFEETDEGTLNTKHEFLPANYTENYVAYTGTHDNDTTRGWYESLDKKMKKLVREYLHTDSRNVVKALIEQTAKSKANITVIPMQDILELDSSARMNYPSSCNDTNWTWRMKRRSFNKRRKTFLSKLSLAHSF